MSVNKYNVGRFCLSEDDCIMRGINFAAYERGVSDAAYAFDLDRTAVTDWLLDNHIITYEQLCEARAAIAKVTPRPWFSEEDMEAQQ